MTLEESWKIMEERGYSESARCNGTKISFYPTDFMNSPNYEVMVNLEDESFTFFYVVPRNVVKVTLGPASSVLNRKQFEKMERKFLEVITVLEAKFRR